MEMPETGTIVVAGAIAAIAGAVAWTAWHLHRTPGRKAIVQALRQTPAGDLWAQRTRLDTNEVEALCKAIDDTEAGTAEGRARLVRQVLDEHARRTRSASDWARAARASEAVGNAAWQDAGDDGREAGQYAIAAGQWTKAMRNATSTDEKSGYAKERDKARNEERRLARRHVPTVLPPGS